MSHRLVCLCGTMCIVLMLPAVSVAQTKKGCQKDSSSSSSSRQRPTLDTSITSGQTPSLNTPNITRRQNQPNTPQSRQQNPQLQQGMQQNLQMQQTMMQQVHQQYQLQDQLKQQLLAFALDAPVENLQRELKNSNAFVRWAASVELNRRWRLEKSGAAAAARAAREMPTPTVLPRRIRAETPATVTSSNQALLLQYGIPNSP